MAFELHTRHANRHYVSPHLVAEKGREAIVRLFDRLYQLGYRTVSKELNFGDFRCAEFVVYRFYNYNNTKPSNRAFAKLPTPTSTIKYPSTTYM